MKKLLFLSAIILFIFLLVLCIYINSRKMKIDEVSDLKNLFGYDFLDSKIEAIYNTKVEDDTICVCVVLQDSVDDFINSEFVVNTGFLGDNGNELYFNKLKRAFPNIFFDINYEQTRNCGSNMKDYVIRSFFSETRVPCPIYWFSTTTDEEEKVVIYGFFPFLMDVNISQTNKNARDDSVP